jgi:hypothetical protein
VVPAKLKRHFTTNHSHLSNKKMITCNDFCIHKTNNVFFEKKVTIGEKAQETSYLVAEILVKNEVTLLLKA